MAIRRIIYFQTGRPCAIVKHDKRLEEKLADFDIVLDDDPHAALREEVRKLCAGFPGPYWRALDREGAYPAEFVAALAEGGWLAALIPEEYGGSGLDRKSVV